MPQATFSVRMDENLKNDFEALCNSFGMSMTTAINVFARAVVREKRIPFEISAVDPFSPENAIRVLNSMHEEASRNGTTDMTMDEIDEEIMKTRKSLKK